MDAFPYDLSSVLNSPNASLDILEIIQKIVFVDTSYFSFPIEMFSKE